MQRLGGIARLLCPENRADRLVRVLLVVDALLLLTGLVLWGFGRPIVEWEVRRRLTRSLGPAASYQIEMRATWGQLILGEVPMMRFQARDLHMKDGLQVAALDVRLRGVRQRGRWLTRLARADYRAEITEEALNAYLPVRPHKLSFEPTVRLRLKEGSVEVRGFKSVLGVPVPLEATGQLLVAGPTRLVFRVDSARFALQALPSWIRELAVLDLADHPFGVRIGELRVRDGGLEIEGTVSPTLPLDLEAIRATPSPTPP